jgi:hypothetical protein
MKRSDLVVGAELYCVDNTGWKHGYPGEKVTVLSVEPYATRKGFGWRPVDRHYKTDKGTGVLIKGEYGRKVVPLAFLRGPYEDGVKHEQERNAATREQALQRAEARHREREERDAITARAARVGVLVTWNGDGFQLSAEGLLAVLDRINAEA